MIFFLLGPGEFDAAKMQDLNIIKDILYDIAAWYKLNVVDQDARGVLP